MAAASCEQLQWVIYYRVIRSWYLSFVSDAASATSGSSHMRAPLSPAYVDVASWRIKSRKSTSRVDFKYNPPMT